MFENPVTVIDLNFIRIAIILQYIFVLCDVTFYFFDFRCDFRLIMFDFYLICFILFTSFWTTLSQNQIFILFMA